MKRIYRENPNGTKELISYDYEGVIIELDYDSTSRSGFRWFRSGYIVPALKEIGKSSWHETLKEAKEWIDKYLR